MLLSVQAKTPSPLVGTRARAPVVPPGLPVGRHGESPSLGMTACRPLNANGYLRLAAPLTLGLRVGLLSIAAAIRDLPL
jgi:hypothetical protein